MSEIDWEPRSAAFGERVRDLREGRGLTQIELAALAGLHRNQISNIERSVSNRGKLAADPRLSTVFVLARALKVSPSELLAGIR